MHKVTKIIPVLLLSFSLASFTQENTEDPDHLLIMGVPQYLITNGIRVDVDVHRKGSSHWYVISPYYYVHQSSVDMIHLGGTDAVYDPYDYEQLFGAGMGLSRKTFLPRKPVSEGFYLIYGISYRYFNIEGNSYTWVEQPGEDGLPYQRMAELDYILNIHSLGASASIGFQKEVMPSCYLDIFLGFGIKYGIHSSPQHVTTRYNRGVMDYGYTGTHLVGGIRLGVGI